MMSDYPEHPDALPESMDRAGPYEAFFARTPEDRDASFRLRFTVFNLELNEGLAASHADRMDRDAYDAACHHLLVRDTRDGAIVGTYRMQTAEHARAARGLYAAEEFDFAGVPDAFLDNAVELGRACIDRGHRSGRVLFLLWRGLARYMRHNRKQHFFGCCSLTSQDPDEGVRVLRHLERAGHMHPTLRLAAQPGCACRPTTPHGGEGPVNVPRLMRTYLDHGARICSEAAIDRDFGTIDYLATLDMNEIDERARRLFLEP